MKGFVGQDQTIKRAFHMNLLPTSSGIKQKNVNQIKQTMLVCPSDIFFFFTFIRNKESYTSTCRFFFFTFNRRRQKKRNKGKPSVAKKKMSTIILNPKV